MINWRNIRNGMPTNEEVGYLVSNGEDIDYSELNNGLWTGSDSVYAVYAESPQTEFSYNVLYWCPEDECNLPIEKESSEFKVLDKIADDIPIQTDIKISNQMAFINLIVELGYREDIGWTDEENELLRKLMSLADKHTDSILKKLNIKNK
jgi:hypothetical protein